jgi:hypothetical protein
MEPQRGECKGVPAMSVVPRGHSGGPADYLAEPFSRCSRGASGKAIVDKGLVGNDNVGLDRPVRADREDWRSATTHM